MTRPPHMLIFNDGYVLDKSHIYIASQIQEYARDDDSRVSAIINGKWYYADFEDAVLSVACLDREKLVFFMGHNGNVMVGGRPRPTFERLPDTKDYGKVLRIRNIGEEIYACGMTGQVYRRESNVWRHVDEGILGRGGLDLEDIGGTGPEDLYVVGSPGAVFHFDGGHWRHLEFPTNRPLGGVRAVSRDEVYVCGDDGNLFRGNPKHWEFIGDPEIDHHFWALEAYMDKIYVAYDGGLFMYDNQGLSEVDFSLGRAIGCHRLHANDGVLWSFGIEDLLYYDGKTWKEVVCPMNS